MEQEQLELIILKHLVQTPEAKEKLTRKQTGLMLEYFEKPASQKLVAWLLLYLKKYNNVPTRADLVLEFARDEINRMEEPLLTWCEELTKQIYMPPPPEEDFQFCIDLLKNNWRKRYGVNSLSNAVSELSQGKFDEFCEQITNVSRKIKLVGQSLPNLNPILDYPQILAEHKYLAANKDLFRKIPTGIKWLDEQLNGGLALGEYYILMAWTGRGKSFFGTQVAFYAALYGFNVVVANLEMSNKKATKRLLSRITGIPIERFIDPWKMTEDNYVTWEDRMVEWKAMNGSIEFITFEKSPTVDDVAAKLHNLSEPPDLLIIDQITNMSGRLEWQDLEMVAKDLELLAKSWAKERGLAILTFGQAKSSSIYRPRLTVQDSAYGKGVCEHATGVFYLSQTVEEEEQRIIKLGISKNRDGQMILDQAELYPNRDIARIHCTERFERETRTEHEDGSPF